MPKQLDNKFQLCNECEKITRKMYNANESREKIHRDLVNGKILNKRISQYLKTRLLQV